MIGIHNSISFIISYKGRYIGGIIYLNQLKFNDQTDNIKLITNYKVIITHLYYIT